MRITFKMSETAIKVENISKRYVINHNRSESDSLVGAFAGGLKNLFNRQSKLANKEDFWALSNINFEINKGDRVGIIGRNGAGKSTLLKILSRIVKPTSGRIEYEGRMASLLEVGTGFHGDLTGRENIYLNGSILGMSKREIDSKFDEIVAFSEIEKFLDTPVKRYSSGMYVRLAFAVAAHLEPEILIVDEVLAVGDAAFQKKCLGKLGDVSNNDGRTVLFVSHNMAAVQNLCNKGIYLQNGKLVQQGRIEEVIPAYLRSGAEKKAIDFSKRTDRSGNGKVTFDSFRLLNLSKEEITAAQCGSDFFIELTVNAKEVTSNFVIALGLDDDLGSRISHLSNETSNQVFERLPAGKSRILIKIIKLPIKSGHYSFTLFASSNSEILDWVQEAGVIDVESGDFYKTGKLAPDGQGSLYIDYKISLE